MIHIDDDELIHPAHWPHRLRRTHRSRLPEECTGNQKRFSPESLSRRLQRGSGSFDVVKRVAS